MFLHSGASLHGHEYSNKPPAPVVQGGNRRQSRFRASLPVPLPRAATSPSLDSSSTGSNSGAGHNTPAAATTSSLWNRVRPLSDCFTGTLETVVRFAEPEHDLVSPKPLVMSEEEGSVDVSDSDVSRTASSSVRQHRRRSTRLATSYLLAQAPPKLGNKQRLIPIRPQLLLQLQELAVGQRPKPTIDVYPSSKVAHTAIAAHLVKRFPRLARIRREESIQDVLLLRSENYAAPVGDSDSDGDDDDIRQRDLIAILSPLTGQDKAEIVLPDGTVWVAAPRVNGVSYSYEFTSVDESGHTTTARWVRRQVTNQRASLALPPTPASSAPPSPIGSTPAFPRSATSSPPLEYKFTFSIINPDSRRHPVMASLTPSSLEVQDSYTTISSSSGRYPPTSQRLATPDQTSESELPSVRTVRAVEHWQKEFIQVSALWVALRQGWVPHFKPTDFIPQTANSGTSPNGNGRCRGRSSSIGSESTVTGSLSRDPSKRRSGPPPALRDGIIPGLAALPRRATSTGAARIRRLRAEQGLSGGAEGNEKESVNVTYRRSFTGDWAGAVGNRAAERNSISEAFDRRRRSDSPELSKSAASPPNTRPGRRPLSEYHTSNAITYVSESEVIDGFDTRVPPSPQPSESQVGGQHTTAIPEGRRQHRWRTVLQWFSKRRDR
ncbi:hypothetical protein BX600DRAFT_511751 [Xylariales sp. PMI_506]|nr:hypothetical protein BX600DRAFT_511751 [Xylariales sp. PMI_506]